MATATGVDWRLIQRRLAKNFKDLQTAEPGDGVLTDTIDALIKGELAVHGYELKEVKKGDS